MAAGKARDASGRLVQKYPDVRGLLGTAKARKALWEATKISGPQSGIRYSAAREGLVIEQLRKLQGKVSAEAGAAAAEAQCASGDEAPLTSDSEEEG